MEQEHLIFLSYSTPDRDEVLAFYEHLDSQGYNVWMDRHKLIGGQNWDLEIKRALQKAAIIVVFLSHNSVDRRGYVQREIKIALEQKEARLIDDIYLIPVLLDDDVAIPEQISQIQGIGANSEDRFSALTNAIEHQLAKLGAQNEKAQIVSNVRWSFSHFEDTMEALPGYDVRYRLIHLSSKEFPRVGEITDIIRGELQQGASECRKVLFNQSPDHHNFGEDRYRRQNSWEADCGAPNIQGRMLSISYSLYWYYAGAAHPNSGFQTFNFSLNPLVRFESLSEMFSNEEEALVLIQRECRKQLLAINFAEEEEGDPVTLDEEWVKSGTAEWEQFSHFLFSENGIEFLFQPYEVAAYVFGPQSASVGYERIAPLLRSEIASLLDVQYLQNGAKPWPFPISKEEKEDGAAANDQDAAKEA